jgi:hypothetical protein
MAKKSVRNRNAKRFQIVNRFREKRDELRAANYAADHARTTV